MEPTKNFILNDKNVACDDGFFFEIKAGSGRTIENGVSSIHHKANAVGIGTFQCNRKIALRRSFRSGVVFASVGQCPGQTAERGYSSPHQYDILVALPHRF